MAGSEKPRHPLFVELGLASPGPKNANGKRSRLKQQGRRPTAIGALDVLQHLLETNVVTTDQLRTAHKALSEARGDKNDKKTEPTKEEEDEKDKKDVGNQLDYRTRHIALQVYYEGNQYSGLAQNVGQDDDESVERHVFAALQKTRLIISRDTCNYSRCGRTDKGVSAVGQIIAMKLKSAIPLEASWDPNGQQIIDTAAEEEAKLPKNAQDIITVWVPPKNKNKNKKKNKKDTNNNNNNNDDDDEKETTASPTQQPARQCKQLREYAYEKMLNSLLPTNIRVLAWCPVSNDFSARFSASNRTYRYFFTSRNLNLQAMREGLKLLVGKHDFRNLCKLNVVEVSNFVRTIYSAELISGMSLFGTKNSNNNNNNNDTQNKESSDDDHVDADDVCYFQIQGQAFLWHQIRCIVSVLFMIGRGLESPSIITEFLNVEKLPGKPSYPLAEEFPLVLHGCAYPNLQLGYSVQNLWTVTCQLESQWKKLVLEAARIRNCLNTLQHEVETVKRNELIQFAKNRLTERLRKEQRNHNNQNNKKQNKNATTSSLSSTDRRDRWTTSLKTIDSEDAAADEGGSLVLSWADAMVWLRRHDMVPDANGLVDHVHIPLLQRSKGTTLEEKLEALQQSSTKRSQRYEENVAKKQKSEGGDEAFYKHMLKQGSS